MAGWITLAHLLRPQGRKGEILADLLTDFPERFDDRKRVFLAAPGFDGPESAAREAEVAAFWLPTGRNQGRIVLELTGITSITQAEALAGLDVIVPLVQRLPLDDDSTYISDLVGCTVYDNSVPIGTVDDVQFPTTPDGTRKLEEAAPLLVVCSPAGHEILVPYAKAFLVSVDTATRRIDMVLPSGLIDINLPQNR